jgi:hypothetical protein
MIELAEYIVASINTALLDIKSSNEYNILKSFKLDELIEKQIDLGKKLAENIKKTKYNTGS